MAFGFPYPRFREKRTFHVGEQELHAAVESAFESLGWPYKVPWGQDFEARVPTSNFSWHHDLKFGFSPGEW